MDNYELYKYILTIGIRGVNFEPDYNEFVKIEGGSGSGKSTLLNVIGANDSYSKTFQNIGF